MSIEARAGNLTKSDKESGKAVYGVHRKAMMSIIESASLSPDDRLQSKGDD
jgi:hypothetical protein